MERDIAELNKKHAVITLGGKVYVLNEGYNPTLGVEEITFSSPENFRTKYSNRRVVNERLGHYWLDHEERREYEGITFSPGKEVPGFYNLWRGFSVEEQEGDCSLYLDHIRDNIASGKEEIYQYLLAWMVDVVQHPSRLPGVAIVLRGKQGTGKGVFVTEFGRLFGSHFKHLAHPKQLTGNFNSHLKDALLVFADEAMWSGRKETEGPLKALITEPTLVIEPKGVDQYVVKNHIHLMMASNNEWVVPAGFEERRFLVLDVSDKHQQDHEYFAAIREQMDGGGQAALLYYLMNYDLDRVNLRRLPKTQALLETKLLSMSPIQKFWYGNLCRGSLRKEDMTWSTEIAVADLREEFRGFLQDVGATSRYTDEEFGKRLNEITRLRRTRATFCNRRTYIYVIPPLEECRRYFELKIGMAIKWEEDSV